MSKGESEHRVPLTYDDRLRIEQGLNRGDAIGMIARTVSRTQTTVRDEIKRNWTDNPVGIMSIKNRNICIKKYECDNRRGLHKYNYEGYQFQDATRICDITTVRSQGLTHFSLTCTKRLLREGN